MEGLFSETNRATERTLTANDYAMVRTHGQACCGALHAHAGDLEIARRLARNNIAAFEASEADDRPTQRPRGDDEGVRAFTGDPAWRDQRRSPLQLFAMPASYSHLRTSSVAVERTVTRRRHLVHAQRSRRRRCEFSAPPPDAGAAEAAALLRKWIRNPSSRSSARPCLRRSWSTSPNAQRRSSRREIRGV
jgi:hypothetical protein